MEPVNTLPKPPNFSTKRGFAYALRLGANLLAEPGTGWTKGIYSYRNQFCAIGACRRAIKNQGLVPTDVSVYNIRAGRVACFNDKIATNKGQVVSYMRKAAGHLEHGGDIGPQGKLV